MLVLVHLIDEVSVADGDLLHEYLVLIVQLSLAWKDDLLVQLLLKAFDLCLDSSVNFGAQFFVEGVCNEVGVGLALSDKVVCQLVDLGDDSLWDDFENLLVGVGDCIFLKV